MPVTKPDLPTPSRAGARTPERLDRVSEITGSWIESVLRHAGLDASVAGIALEPFGDGKVSDTARVQITYRRPVAEAPSSVICKFHSAQPGAHQFAIGADLYLHELQSYRVVGGRGACRMPRHFLAEGDNEWINLVMADLSGITEPGDQLGGCDLDQSRAVMHEIADLHATFLDLDPDEAPAWLTRLSDSATVWCAPAAVGARLSAEWFADRLSATSLRLLERLPRATECFFVHPLNRLALTHGDVKADNVMFTREDGQVRALFLDWQNVGLRSPAFDFAYFLSGSVTTADRREHEHELLRHYADRLAERSASYDLDAIIEDYRVQLLSGALQTASAVAFMSAGGEHEIPAPAQHFLATLLERNLAAIGDWDSIGALTP